MATTHHKISNGPSKDELFYALRFNVDPLAPRNVSFVTDDGIEFMAGISGIEYEDGSGFCFIIKGYASSDGRLRRHFEGFYRTHSHNGGRARTGYIHI